MKGERKFYICNDSIYTKSLFEGSPIKYSYLIWDWCRCEPLTEEIKSTVITEQEAMDIIQEKRAWKDIK